jgi:hypothetical protein
MKHLSSPAVLIALVMTMATAPYATAAPAPEAPAAAPAAATQPAKAPATDLEPYELKNKSSVSIPAGTRPPYWPIGWRPDGTTTTRVPKRVEIDENYFKVTSILIANPSIALINGRSYEEGQFIRMPKGSPVRPRVFRVTDGQVVIQVDTQMITVPLKRPELNEKKTGVEMLNEEKEDTSPVPIKP